jgi:hypothetical protein
MYARSGSPTPGVALPARHRVLQAQARKIPDGSAPYASRPQRGPGASKTPPSEQEVIGYIDAGSRCSGLRGLIEKARLLMARAPA